ncbi:ABC transporter permease [Segnochrobactrum spirostomi]|uniref:ABC transporter permease n=1 Tax=Segnochrobactrum spirostomi TaxID=2608987 RepID=UPI0028B12E53|nr:ABC transporter permease [Segnochrobactrum spirostomi]
MHVSTNLAAPDFAARKGLAVPRLPMRFVAIWIALAGLGAICAVLLPRSVAPITLQTVLPFAAFLTIAAMGQALVLMARSIDLSVPSIVALSSAVLLGVSHGNDERLWLAITAALLAAVAIGAINAFFVAVLRMNGLVVTLATGAIVGGVTLWYRQGLAAEAKVPLGLASFAGGHLWDVPVAAWFAVAVMAILTIGLRKTLAGRRFEAVGANPRAAHACGIRTTRYQGGAFILASLLYGVLAVLLSGFIRNPTLEVGNPYLLAPIAAAVLGGTAISGGIGSMVAVLGASLFVMQLDQASKMMGLATSWQLIVQGLAIVAGMWLSEASSKAGRR